MICFVPDFFPSASPLLLGLFPLLFSVSVSEHTTVNLSVSLWVAINTQFGTIRIVVSFGELTDIFLLGLYLEVQKHREYKRSALADTAEQFFQVEGPLCNPPSSVQEFQVLHTLAALGIFCLLFLATLAGGMYQLFLQRVVSIS